MTSAIALAPRPYARALDPTPVVPAAPAAARQAVLIAPPKPKPVAGAIEQGIRAKDPGSTHGKRLRVSEDQIDIAGGLRTAGGITDAVLGAFGR